MSGRQYYRIAAAVLIAAAFLLAFSASGEAYIVTGGVPPQFGPAPGEGNTQYSSGVFEYSKVDLTIPAPMPIKIVRTYRSEDKNPQGQFNNRGFGLGTTINYDIYLYSSAEVNNQANKYSTIDLITADGGRIVFQCAPGANCSTYTSAVLVSNSQPVGLWFGAVLSYNASVPGWDVTLKDGTVYVFGQGAPLQSITDRYNNSISIGRSGTNITGISASNGRSVGFTYTGSNITKITDTSDSNGETVTYGYNSNHALTSVKYNYNYDGYSFLLGGEVEYSYDPTYLGDITQFQVGVTTDDNQTVATWATPVNVSYDISRRMSQVISQGASSGYTYLYALDPTHTYIQTSTITLPDALQFVVTFDAHGYTINDQRGTGGAAETTAITRYSDELIQEINENNLRTTSFIYDSYGNATSVTRSPGPGTLSSITATALYQQPFNELESVTDPLNNTSTFFYDSNGSLITAKDPLQRATSLTHNAAGQLATIADPLMDTTHIGYTTAGDLASFQDPAGTLTQYVYDFNKLTSTMEPSNGFDQTTYYDGFGHIKSSQDGDLNTTGWTYDLMGHVTSMTDANGDVTSIAPTTGSNGVSLCDASMQCAYSYYDNASKLTSTVDKRGITTTYTYDSLDRLSVKTVNSTNLPGWGQHVLTYGYDSLNRVTSVQDSLQALTTNFTYDGINDVTSETTSALNNNVAYGYDADGRRTSLSASGGGHAGVSYSYNYDIASDLTGITGGLETVTIVPDGAGRRHTLTVGNVVTTYGYDADSRINSLTYTVNGNSIGNLTYTYDSNGRLTTTGGSLAGINLGTSEGASALNTFWPTNQINTWNGVTVSHDSANNLTQIPVSSVALTWNARNQLGTFSSISFGYDQFGRRFNANWPSGTTNFLYDGASVIQAASSSEVDTAFRIGGGEVLAYKSSVGSTLIPIHDRLGSTIGLVNPSTGALQTQYSYDAYGNVTAAGTASNFPFLFAGMEYDIPTGLYHTLARYYAPSIQRFLSEDPMGIAGGDINLFTYVGNSPTNGIDPLGQQDSSDMNGDYPTGMFITPGFSSFDPLGNATQIAVLASQQSSSSTQTTIGGGGQGGGISINISSGGANQQESSANNGSENNEQVVNGSGGGFSSSRSTSSTPALGSNPGTTVGGLSSSSVEAIGGQVPHGQPVPEWAPTPGSTAPPIALDFCELEGCTVLAFGLGKAAGAATAAGGEYVGAPEDLSEQGAQVMDGLVDFTTDLGCDLICRGNP